MGSCGVRAPVHVFVNACVTVFLPSPECGRLHLCCTHAPPPAILLAAATSLVC